MDGVKQFFKTIWKYWKKFGEFMGNLIGRLFLMLFYITIALPFGLLTRLFGDTLRTKRSFSNPTWNEREAETPTLEGTYNQF